MTGIHHAALGATLFLTAAAQPGCEGCGHVVMAGDAFPEDAVAQDPVPEDASFEDLVHEDTHPDDQAVEDMFQDDAPADEIELPPPRCWARSYDFACDDLAWCVELVHDGRFLVLGRSDHTIFPLDPAVVLFALDGYGEPEWHAAFGGEMQGWPRELAPTEGHGFVLTGWITSFGPGFLNAWVMRLNPGLTVAWQKTYDHGADSYAECVRQTSDGGFIVVGYSAYAFWELMALKIDRDGNAQWQSVYGGEHDDFAMAVRQTMEGGYLTAGGSYSFGAGSCDAWVLNLDPDGDPSWQKTYGGSGYDYATDLVEAPDEGTVISGETRSLADGSSHVFVMKIDDQGSVLWQKVFVGHGYETVYSMSAAPGGGYVLTGDLTHAETSDVDALVIRLDENGNMLWQKTFGGAFHDWGRFVRPTMDGGFIVAGYSRSYSHCGNDFWVLKMDGEGLISESCPPELGRDADLETMDAPFSSASTHVSARTVDTSVGTLAFSRLDSDLEAETQCMR